MSSDATLMELFEQAGAIITNSHFVYSSGRHSSVYVNKDALYLRPELISSLCERMGQPYDPEQIDVVVGPTIGAVILSQWTAYHLTRRKPSGEILAVFAEKGSDGVDKQFFFGRGYDKFVKGSNVLVVEDILTTGGSARQTIEAVRRYGGNVIGLSVLCNRGNVGPEQVGGVPIHALVELPLQTYTAEECPFCRDGVPINTELGKGRTFLAKQQAADAQKL
ncbi:orotate phosphoribosyltransferase [Ktedonobacter sp. SOSP1-85]|uniref:phosphoribosyltransferase family protein n=1 Tax=Ktedonobacter sp. SOSP1-85 TaxID=2778367 RepID=UPI001915E82C|nr:phosphoribosyltransferase family protein [Ktedonobacter sp. SOSP1-85]GHO73145.1 orotate phosphoribosyltransferase [Ktedonobacter sp. SOSP1-85]